MTPCRATDCDRQSTRRGLCHRCYMREYSRQHAYGRWKSGHVDAQPVRDHLDKLQAAGLGMRVIAEQTGVARSTLRAILNGKKRATSEGSKIEPPRHHVMQATAQAILAVALPTPLDPRIPDNTPSMRPVPAGAYAPWPPSAGPTPTSARASAGPPPTSTPCCTATASTPTPPA